MVSDFMTALLERKHNLGQQFANGWVFGSVVNYEDIQIPYDLYGAMTTGTGTVTLNTVAGEWHEWANAQNQLMFRERDGDKILQAFIGISPTRLRLFHQFPAPIIRGNLYEIKVPAVKTATSGGYITGELSPYEMPTTLTEFIVPPELHLQWGLFNPETYTVYPRFNIFIRRCQMNYFDPDSKSGKEKIEQITNGKVPCKLWSPGLDPYEYDTGDRMDVEQYEWTPGVIMNKDEE